MTAAPARLTTADRALLRARIGWGQAAEDRFWGRFAQEWRERLQPRLGAGPPMGSDPSADRTKLCAEHARDARTDLTRIHPSWWLRALKDESPAVQRAVARHASARVGAALRAGLGLSEADCETDRPPHSEALQWALTLWTERLVAGPPALPDDPPALAALTRLDRHARYRFVAVTGLAKLAYAIDLHGAPDKPGGLEGLRPRDLERITHFRSVWGQPEPRFIPVSRQDLRTAQSQPDQTLQRLGLITIARLLTEAEPHRVRWAFQHLPYHVAKYIRTRMTLDHPLVSAAALVGFEAKVFNAARDRLRAERRLRDDWGKRRTQDDWGDLA